MNKYQKVVIIGASNKPDRYSYKAFKMLREYGHTPIPVHPVLATIDDCSVVASLESIDASTVDTITLYVNPEILKNYIDEIIRIKPSRVIMNPGTESDDAEQQFLQNGIKVLRACTLVLLRTGQF
ncbi:MAG: CoA-binding protein [Fibrobacterota bacterium]|nr:CoA-binding protein [Chitinispirillaceae bacterium]